MAKNVIDTALTEESLHDMLIRMKDGLEVPIQIKPTQLIISEEAIERFSKEWNLSRFATIERMQEIAKGLL